MHNPGLRIAHVFPGHVFGGLPKIAAELAAAQRAQGLDATLVSLYRDPATIAYCEARSLPILATRGPSRNPQAWWDLARALRRAAPDIVHLHTGVLWSNALGLALKTCPWVYHAHDYVEPCGVKSRLQIPILRRLCDAYIGISDSVSDAIRRVIAPRAPVVTILNGLPVPPRCAMRTAPVGRDSTRYGMATRLAPGKGVIEFLDVAAEIARLDAHARFVLAGDGPLAPAVRDRASALGIADRLDMPGFVADVETFWKSLDVAVFTAPKEPFGLRLIEPMALGVPVAAYRTGAGSDEIIEDGVSGFMASWGDAPALAHACVRLACEADLAAQIMAAARERVEQRFSVEAMVQGVHQVYERVRSGGISRQAATAPRCG